MLINVYGTPSSSTRKVKQWFESRDIQYIYRDLREQPLTIKEIQHILSLTENGTEDILYVRSVIFKQLYLDIDNLSLQDLLRYIKKYPDLMRNPLIFDKQKLQIGFSEHDIRQFIPSEERRALLMDLFVINNNPQIEGV